MSMSAASTRLGEMPGNHEPATVVSCHSPRLPVSKQAYPSSGLDAPFRPLRCPLRGLPQGRDALAHADAHAGCAPAGAALPELVQQGGRDPRTRAAARVPDRYGAPVALPPVGIELELVRHRHRLPRERLIDLDEVEVADLPAGPRESLTHGGHRANAHVIRMHSGRHRAAG